MLEVVEFVRVEKEMCGESIGAGNIVEKEEFGFDGTPTDSSNLLEVDTGAGRGSFSDRDSPKTVPDVDRNTPPWRTI